eukprot:1140367-Prorocentrum_minimum.AAC.1
MIRHLFVCVCVPGECGRHEAEPVCARGGKARAKRAVPSHGQDAADHDDHGELQSRLRVPVQRAGPRPPGVFVRARDGEADVLRGAFWRDVHGLPLLQRLRLVRHCHGTAPPS